LYCREQPAHGRGAVCFTSVPLCCFAVTNQWGLTKTKRRRTRLIPSHAASWTDIISATWPCLPAAASDFSPWRMRRRTPKRTTTTPRCPVKRDLPTLTHANGQMRRRAIPHVFETLERARDDGFHLEEVSDLRSQGASRETSLVCPPSHARPAASGCQPAACLHLGPNGDQLQQWTPRGGQATLRTSQFIFGVFGLSYCWLRAANPPCNAFSTHPRAARRSATTTAVSTMRGTRHLTNNPDKGGNLANTSLH